MKPLMAKFLTVVFMVAMVVGLLIPIQTAEARGFSGGSFRGGAGFAEGPRGGEVARGPEGGAAATGPEGAAAVRSPYGGAAAVGPGGGAAATGPYGATAVRGPQGYAARGYRVSAIPATATPVVVAGQTYYVDNHVYYQSYFDGDEVVYVVVPAPE